MQLEIRRRVRRSRGYGKLAAAYVAYKMRSPAVPVVVYTVGKVGSMAVYEAIRCRYSPTFHFHNLSPSNIDRIDSELRSRGMVPPERARALALHELVIEGTRPAKFINIVRDPVERNVSDFFSMFRFATGRRYRPGVYDPADLKAMFLAAELGNGVDPDSYYRRELLPVLGVDVGMVDFPREVGYAEFSAGRHQLLLMKSELPDGQKEEALSRFVGGEGPIRIMSINETSRKEYGEDYRRFLREVELPEDYLDRAYGAAVVRAVYTIEEIEAFRARWRSGKRNRWQRGGGEPDRV